MGERPGSSGRPGSARSRPGSSGGFSRWKTSSLRSGFGYQVPSQKTSAPGIGFGSANRDGCARLYVSAEADRAKVRGEGGPDSPGPVYRTQEVMGRQFLSTIESEAVATFGMAKREGMSTRSRVPGPGHYLSDNDATHHKSGAVRFAMATRGATEKVYISAEHDRYSGGRDSPGPCMYDEQAGQAWLSDHHKEPAWSIGSSTRSGNKQSGSSPGTGSYSSPSTIGPNQLLKKSSSVIAFGRASRDASGKLYLGSQLSKSGCGSSPGPTTAAQYPVFRKQQLSTKSNAPSVGFARSVRRFHTSGGPGPGDYDA